MNNSILNIYIFSFFVSTFLLIKTSPKLYDKIWFYKTILVYIATSLILYSIFRQNKIIDTYLIPLLIFLNIGILIFTTKKSYLGYLNIILILYLLYHFNYKDLKIKGGKLLSPNYQFIVLYIVILIFYFITNKGITNKLSHIVLVLYPLLFPKDEYFIHRAFPLLFAVSIRYYLYHNLKIILFK